VKGLSLLETVVAGALFFFVTILLLNLFPSSLLSLKAAENRARAERLAQACLEENEAFAFTMLGRPPAVTQQWDGLEFTIQLEIYALSGVEQERLRQVRAVVSWTERNERRSAARETYVSRAYGH
jgi:hypothetical protein